MIEVHDAGSAPHLRAIAFTWRREIVAEPVRGERDGGFVISRRRLFPITGRLDLLDAVGGRRLGSLHRSGRVRDATGHDLGKFRDPRTLRDWGGETVFELVGAIVTGSEGGDPGRMPQDRTWVRGGREQGRLRRTSWPFAPTAEGPPPDPRGLSRFLPRRLARFMRSLGDPPTWRFDWVPLEGPWDRRLPIAAAVWAVELSHW